MTATRLDMDGSGSARSLRARLRETALVPTDPGYDAARAAWNLNVQHRPAVVVMAEDPADIRAAVRFARSADLGVGVLATGHGTGTPCNGGLLINTSRMRGVQVDPVRQLARVAAGTIWEDVVEAAAVHGLVGSAGSSTRVGVVGYTLGGGFGWLGRRYGLASQSVTAADVVTADGELLRASATEHPDLLWGLLGSAGNLGVVTALEFRLHPVRRVYAGNLYHPLARARELLEFFAGWSRGVPPELTAAVTFRSFPDLPAVPEPLRGTSLVALRGCFCGDPARGAALVDEARAALGQATVDTFATIPASALASVSMDPVEPLSAAGHSELLMDLSPATIDALLELPGPAPGSPLVMVEVRQLGGALVGPADALSPMARTAARFSLNAIGATRADQPAGVADMHLAEVAARMRPHATGETYLNFLELNGATPERVRAAYSETDWDRLLGLKARYDPRHVFRFNRNLLHSTTRPAPREGTPA